MLPEGWVGIGLPGLFGKFWVVFLPNVGNMCRAFTMSQTTAVSANLPTADKVIRLGFCFFFSGASSGEEAEDSFNHLVQTPAPLPEHQKHLMASGSLQWSRTQLLLKERFQYH